LKANFDFDLCQSVFICGKNFKSASLRKTLGFKTSAEANSRCEFAFDFQLSILAMLAILAISASYLDTPSTINKIFSTQSSP
jgi:hypothetical protein